MAKPVSSEYQELIHYTTAAGLSGIVESGCIWATHAAFLNDSEEIRHFFDSRLVPLVAEEVTAHLGELLPNPSLEQEIAKHGGVQAFAMWEAKNISERLRGAVMSFNDPYVFSLSAPTDEAVSRSGLLSQWRGYGPDGGYAIVFDTGKIEELIHEESRRHLYKQLQWGDVFYHPSSAGHQPASAEVMEWESDLREIVRGMIRGEEPKAIGRFYPTVTALSCVYKHWGFAEEHEVRVVAIPASLKDVDDPNNEKGNPPEKPVRTFQRAGSPVPYIELFRPNGDESPRGRLPIKRVIVGPHRDSARRKNAVERLLSANGYVVEVSCSEIPYIGR